MTSYKTVFIITQNRPPVGSTRLSQHLGPDQSETPITEG